MVRQTCHWFCVWLHLVRVLVHVGLCFSKNTFPRCTQVIHSLGIVQKSGFCLINRIRSFSQSKTSSTCREKTTRSSPAESCPVNWATSAPSFCLPFKVDVGREQHQPKRGGGKQHHTQGTRGKSSTTEQRSLPNERRKGRGGEGGRNSTTQRRRRKVAPPTMLKAGKQDHPRRKNRIHRIYQ